jgi:RecB family exonuclease
MSFFSRGAAAAVLDIEQPGDVLSPSSASQYLGCSAKFFYRKVKRLPDPPTGSLALGAALHHALGVNFAEKVESKRDLPIDGVAAVYRQAWDLKVAGKLDTRHDELPVEFRDDEEPATLKAMGEVLVRKYMDEQAPTIEPAAVEMGVNGRIGGVQVRGYIDLLDTSGRIIDIKTAARKPSDVDSSYRFQVATYSQLTPGASRQARVDTLTKTKTPALVSQEFTIDQSDVDATQKLYPLVQRSIRAGVFTPNRQSYMCSRKYCAFWRACQADFGGKVAPHG